MATTAFRARPSKRPGRRRRRRRPTSSRRLATVRPAWWPRRRTRRRRRRPTRRPSASRDAPGLGGGGGAPGPFGPPGGPPPPGPGGQDPYLAGGWGSSIGPQRKRLAFDTYWELRRQAQSVRAYLSTHYKGGSGTQEYADLWTLAEIIDGMLDAAYRSGGLDAVNYVLWYDDTAEHIMARVGAQIAYLRSGDRRVYNAIITAKPPGESDILPDWALQEARDHSKALYNQECRVAGSAPAKAPRHPAVAPPGAAVPAAPNAVQPGPKATPRAKRTRGKKEPYAAGGAAPSPP